MAFSGMSRLCIGFHLTALRLADGNTQCVELIWTVLYLLLSMSSKYIQ